LPEALVVRDKVRVVANAGVQLRYPLKNFSVALDGFSGNFPIDSNHQLAFTNAREFVTCAKEPAFGAQMRSHVKWQFIQLVRVQRLVSPVPGEHSQIPSV
jgi:hypothetical protein